jgi:ketosteroid isomerase-like protein
VRVFPARPAGTSWHRQLGITYQVIDASLPPGEADHMDTRETVDQLLRRVAGGAPEKIAELYADDVDWMLDWPDDDYSQTVPWIRHRSTRAGVADHFRLIAEHHVSEQSSATIRAVLVDGTDAVVLGEFDNTAKPTGRRYVAAFALHLTVEHGLIIRHHVYEDSLAVARAFAAA